MIYQFILVMALVAFAAIIQRNFKVPAPVTLMATVLLAMFFDFPLFTIQAGEFDNLVILTLPLLIAADALKLELHDIKTNGISLFWVAVVSVILSVAAGLLVNDYVILDYVIPTAGVVLLFCMVSATDPITVSSVFSNFKVPHKLKVITEGESLFNDATALIVFSIAMVALQKPELVSIGFIATKTSMIIGGAVAIGAILGYITIFLMKLSDEAYIEATILLCSAYIAYVAAEHFHFSGILAVIVDMVIAAHIIGKTITKDEKSGSASRFTYAVTTAENKKAIMKSVDFVALFASSILFISVASIANLDRLYHYKYEIIAVFLASTIIRGVMMLKFSFVSNRTTKMQNIKSHWWAVLTFAGSKGALSILMVHMLPSTFEYKELFENIIVGNIFLSTFVYAGVLAHIIAKNKEKFNQECELDHT